MSKSHLRLEHSELIRVGSPSFRAHPLSSPLESSIDLLGEMHLVRVEAA